MSTYFTEESELTLDSTVLGIALMREILYDNGCINALEPDGPDRYPAHWVKSIGDHAVEFFSQHPELLTKDRIFDLATASIDEEEGDFVYADYIHEPAFVRLSEAMDEWYNEGI